MDKLKALQWLVRNMPSWPVSDFTAVFEPSGWMWQWSDREVAYELHSMKPADFPFNRITEVEFNKAINGACDNHEQDESADEWTDLVSDNIDANILAEKVGTKYDQGKPRYDLVPVHAEAEFVDVLSFGASKYGPENWREVDDHRARYTAAMLRHIAAYRMGEETDPESGRHHLAHAMCCAAFLVEKDLEEYA